MKTKPQLTNDARKYSAGDYVRLHPQSNLFRRGITSGKIVSVTEECYYLESSMPQARGIKYQLTSHNIYAKL